MPVNVRNFSWIAIPLLVSGLVILGFALERNYHYMIASLGWGMFVCGIMIATTGYYQVSVGIINANVMLIQVTDPCSTYSIVTRPMRERYPLGVSYYQGSPQPSHADTLYGLQ